MVVTGGADRPACETYVRQLLVPSLRPGQVVIMDRLNVHRGAAIQALIEAAGYRLLLLPSYSPDCNPIEQAFAKIKTHSALRRGAHVRHAGGRYRARPRHRYPR